jgi:hypothetical protein
VRRGLTSAFDPKLTSHLAAVALEWLFQAQRELALRRIRPEHGHTTQRALGASPRRAPPECTLDGRTGQGGPLHENGFRDSAGHP